MLSESEPIQRQLEQITDRTGFVFTKLSSADWKSQIGGVNPSGYVDINQDEHAPFQNPPGMQRTEGAAVCIAGVVLRQDGDQFNPVVYHYEPLSFILNEKATEFVPPPGQEQYGVYGTGVPIGVTKEVGQRIFGDVFHFAPLECEEPALFNIAVNELERRIFYSFSKFRE